MSNSLHVGFRILHWVIIINFALQVLYGSYMTFVVLAPEGTTGPLFGAAHQMSHEDLVVRRMYANETWLAIVGLSLYLALTEILPRRLNQSFGRR